MRPLITLLLLLTAMPAMALPDFDAWYTAYKGSFKAATSHISFRSQSGRYEYRNQARAAGVIAIFRSDRINEISRGRLIDGRPQPEEYHYLHRNGKRVKKEMRVTFRRSEGLAISTYKGHTYRIAIPDGAIDRFSVQITLMHDFSTKGIGTREYAVADKSKLKHYRFVVSGRHTIETTAGRFDTIRVSRAHRNGKRTTYMYFAPSLGYLMVRMEHVEKDGSRYRMDLTRVSGL